MLTLRQFPYLHTKILIYGCVLTLWKDNSRQVDVEASLT